MLAGEDVAPLFWYDLDGDHNNADKTDSDRQADRPADRPTDRQIAIRKTFLENFAL